MTEPTIVCPNCKTEINLTESLPHDAVAENMSLDGLAARYGGNS